MVRRLVVALLAIAAVSQIGCVERRFRVESNPPGAYLYVNNVPYGPTPVDVPFLYYGDYDMMLMKEGFQTLKVKEPISTPWYQYPIIDFFAESLYPAQITDIRPLRYELEPAIQPNLELLRAEGEELRRRGRELPAPRYPDIDKKDEKDKQEPKKSPPGKLPFPSDALPPPREGPALPPPREVEPRL